MMAAAQNNKIEISKLICSAPSYVQLKPSFHSSRPIASLAGIYPHSHVAVAFAGTVRRVLSLAYDCLWCAQSRAKRGKRDCGVYLPDLEHKRPPDMPPGMVKLRLVVSK
jgi:hypothetical protein